MTMCVHRFSAMRWELSLFFIISMFPSAWTFSCKDQHNFDVPWYIAYKMPREKGDTVGATEGTGFYYLDANDPSKLRPSPVSIDQEHQAIGYTLSQYYSNVDDANVLHVFYNDEPAPKSLVQSDPKSVEKAHAKGVVLFDSASGSGIWLIHSVPKFPQPEGGYDYPEKQRVYAQTHLCLTLDAAQINVIGQALYTNHPDIYSFTKPAWLDHIAPDLVKVLDGKYSSDSSASTLHTKISLVNALRFELYAKSHLFDKDLWEDLVAVDIGEMEVETWRRGDLIEPHCSLSNTVVDVAAIKVGGTSFTYGKDHGKWGRTIDSKGATVCIGDINRMTTQFKRGGGAVCIKNQQLWNAFDVVTKKHEC